MKLQYIQKLTLLDYPGKVACTVFLYGCNFRCPFCHNPALVTRPPEEGQSLSELTDLLNKRRGILEGVAVTGGEPLLNDGVFELLYTVRDAGFPVKLDTNGFFPDRLRRAIEEHLVDYVAVDIKNSPSRYAETVGLPSVDLSPLLESISLLEASGIAHEYRTTVIREYHDARSLTEAASLIRGTDRYYLQCFRDTGDLLSGGCSAYTAEELAAVADAVRSIVPAVALRGV